jgi:branched-chain amino acid transport system ATP-binding protein
VSKRSRALDNLSAANSPADNLSAANSADNPPAASRSAANASAANPSAPAQPAPALSTPVLSTTGMSAGYNGTAVVRDIDLTVAAGEIVALLGANGAGKTTTLSAIAGLIKPLSGDILLSGVSIVGRPAYKLAREGVALVPEDRALFAELTTRENLRVAGVRGRARESEEQILELLPELKKCITRKAGLLSGGEQQMLAVGRALVGRPRLLIVDEMSLGLAPVVVERLLPVLRDVATTLNTAVLVVEQHVALAMEVASRAYVLAHGRLTLEGSTDDLRSSESLITASYFGDLDAAAELAATSAHPTSFDASERGPDE